MAHALSKSCVIIQAHKDRQGTQCVFVDTQTSFSTEQGGTEYSGRWELLKQNDQIEIMAQIIWGKG